MQRFSPYIYNKKLRQRGNKAMVYRWNSCVILLVHLCSTVGIAMLHLLCKGAAPFVPDSCTPLPPFFRFVYRAIF